MLNAIHVNNIDSVDPLNIDYDGVNICKLTNDGKMTLSSGIQLNGIDGLEIYNGEDKRAHLDNGGGMFLHNINTTGPYTSTAPCFSIIDRNSGTVIYKILDNGVS